MAFNHQYPYTDFHELNLDWVLSKVTGLDDRLNEIEHNIELLQEDCQNLHEICDNLTGFINDLLSADQKILKMIASEYDEGTQYDPDFLVRYEGKLYKCKPGQTPGPFDSTYWEETDLGTELGNLLYNYYLSLLPHIADMDDNITELYTLFDIIGKEYDPNQTYYEGQTCYYEGKEYICINDGTTGTWNPSKWTETSVNALLDNIAVLGGVASSLRGMIASDYDPNNTYAAGDYVLSNEYLYRALVGVPVNTIPASSPEYWVQVTISSELKEKPSKVGEYDNMLVGAAKGIYTGNFNDQAPYIYRSISGRGNMAIMNKLIGGSVVWNQLVEHGNFDATTGWGVERGTLTVNNNVGTYTVTTPNSSARIQRSISVLANHLYLAFMTIKNNSSANVTTYVNTNGDTTSFGNVTVNSGQTVNYAKMYKVNADGSIVRFYFNTSNCTANDMLYLQNFQFIDITAELGTTIANYIYTLEQGQSGSGVAWFRKYFDKSYYAFATPHIESTKVSAKIVKDSNNTTIASYDLSGSHLVKRKYGVYTLQGNEDWTVIGSGTEIRAFITALNNQKTSAKGICNRFLYGSATNVGEFDLSSNFLRFNINGIATTKAEFNTWINNQTAPITVIYELATPTTETVTNPTLYGIWKLDANNNLYFDGDEISDIPNPQIVPDGGTEEYIDAAVTDGLRDVSIPAGQDSDYSEDLVKKLEDLPYVPIYDTSIASQIGITLNDKKVMRRYIEVTGLSSGTQTMSAIFDWTDASAIVSMAGCYTGDDDGVMVSLGAAQYIDNPSGDATFYINAIGTNTTYTLHLVIDYIEA